MKLFLATFVLVAIAVAAMAIGVILSNRRIQGSCGGLAALGLEKACDCDKPCARRLQMEKDNRRHIEFEP